MTSALPRAAGLSPPSGRVDRWAEKSATAATMASTVDSLRCNGSWTAAHRLAASRSQP